MAASRFPSVKAVSFDVGSTLVYPDPPVERAVHGILRERGHAHVGLGEVAALIPRVNAYYRERFEVVGRWWSDPASAREIWMEMYRFMARELGLGCDAEGIANAVFELYTRGSHWSAYPDVPGTLEALTRAGVRLLVISNWDEYLIGMLAEMGLAPFFETIISSADVGCQKPEERIFRIACERMGLAPEDVLHVGDLEDADFEGATAAGLQGLVIDRPAALDPEKRSDGAGEGSEPSEHGEGSPGHVDAVSAHVGGQAGISDAGSGGHRIASLVEIPFLLGIGA